MTLKNKLLLGCVFSACAMPYLFLGEGHYGLGMLIVKRTKAVLGGHEIDVDEVV